MRAIEENNKLIEEFLGWDINNPSTFPTQLHQEEEIQGYWELSFHSDWNLLMEVVQKITDLNNVVEIHDNHVRVVSNERNNALIDVVEGSMLEATYNACVSFVKWYNGQKQY